MTAIIRADLTPKPLASSVYVPAPEALSPRKRTISVTSLFRSLFEATKTAPHNAAIAALADTLRAILLRGVFSVCEEKSIEPLGRLAARARHRDCVRLCRLRDGALPRALVLCPFGTCP